MDGRTEFVQLSITLFRTSGQLQTWVEALFDSMRGRIDWAGSVADVAFRVAELFERRGAIAQLLVGLARVRPESRDAIAKVATAYGMDLTEVEGPTLEILPPRSRELQETVDAAIALLRFSVGTNVLLFGLVIANTYVIGAGALIALFPVVMALIRWEQAKKPATAYQLVTTVASIAAAVAYYIIADVGIGRVILSWLALIGFFALVIPGLLGARRGARLDAGKIGPFPLRFRYRGQLFEVTAQSLASSVRPNDPAHAFWMKLELALETDPTRTLVIDCSAERARLADAKLTADARDDDVADLYWAAMREQIDALVVALLSSAESAEIVVPGSEAEPASAAA
jgi:hypothetical protein